MLNETASFHVHGGRFTMMPSSPSPPKGPLTAPAVEKPEESFLLLCRALASAGTPFTLATGDSLPACTPPSTECVHIITDGCFTLTRRHDGLLVAVDSAPFIFGLTELFHYPSGYDLIAERPCQGCSLPAESLKAELSRMNLWQDVAQILAYFVYQLAQRDNQLIAVNAYTMVRHKLLELMSLPEAVRMDINVQQFIHQRTRLSRSGIMKILADLRIGEFITIEQGRLVDIRTLPTDY